ncbi:MAG: hypothetical protein O3A95_07295 [Planctomycetota bacterium]|nr:hypothetical protein [Planctomycetota bacterium]MDA1114088.1 hypothetical protein [Planctomycetota bacterium]
MGQIPHLNSEWEKGNAQGLVVISVTDEPAELVETWIATNNVTHPVVILADKKLENVIGVAGFPTSAVFLNKVLQWKGHPSEAGGALGAALKEGRSDSVYPKNLSKVIKTWNGGDRTKALSELYKTMPKLEGSDLEWAGRLDGFMKDESAKAFQLSSEAMEAGFWFRGLQLAQPYLGKGSEYPRVDETRSHLALMQENPGYAKEVKGGELYEEAKLLERNMEYSEAVKVYKKIMKKSADTAIAGHAETAAKSLIDGYKPGFSATCPKCDAKSHAACAKHRETVKL